jgi:hypothetical protein
MRPPPRPIRRPWPIIAFLAVCSASLLVPGVVLFENSVTGTPARATVGDCETEGSGRYETTRCTGSWIVGGSLLEGGHVIVGPIEGVDQDAIGKDVDVMLHGDTAYSRSPTTGLVLLGIGIITLVGAGFFAFGPILRPRLR